MHIAHNEGNFFCTNDELKLLEDHVDARIEDILNSHGFEPEDVTSAALAAYVGKGRIKKYFTTYAQDPKLSRGSVLTQAMATFEDDIKNDYKITTTGKGDKYEPHFGTFSIGAKRKLMSTCIISPFIFLLLLSQRNL